MMNCKTWLIEYDYEGRQYIAEVKANDHEEAVLRKSAIARGVVIGELMASIPAMPGTGWLVRVFCAVRNWMNGK